LFDNENIRAMVGEHIYPVVAPENTFGDFIIYFRQSYHKELSKMGIYQDIVKMAVVVVSENYDRSVELAELIDSTLTGTFKSDDCSMDILLEDSTETFEDNKYIQTLVFVVK
jgi:hypothetical protein